MGLYVAPSDLKLSLKMRMTWTPDPWVFLTSVLRFSCVPPWVVYVVLRAVCSLNKHSANWATSPILRAFWAETIKQWLSSSSRHSTLLWNVLTIHLKPVSHSVHTGVCGCLLRCGAWEMAGLNPASGSSQLAWHRSDKLESPHPTPRSSSYRFEEMFSVGVLVFVLLKKTI